MKTFDYQPVTREALTQFDSTIRPYAGGTDLLPLMKLKVMTPHRLVDIKTEGSQLTELHCGVQETEDGILLGALTTLSEIETSASLQRDFTLLGQAASLAATPQIRNRATLGGTLVQRPRCWYYRNPHLSCWLKGGDHCPARTGQNQYHALYNGLEGDHGDSDDEASCVAVHPSDLASCLMAADASVNLLGADSSRTLPLSAFYAPPTAERRKETVIADDELIASLHLPALPVDSQSLYLKVMDRKAWSFALVGLAAIVVRNGPAIADIRLVLTGVAPVPWRLHEVEHALMQDNSPSPREAGELALREARPLQHNGYKLALVRQLLERALNDLL